MNKKTPKKSLLDHRIVKGILYLISISMIISLIVRGFDPITSIIGLSCLLYLISDILMIEKRRKQKETEIDEIGKP